MDATIAAASLRQYGSVLMAKSDRDEHDTQSQGTASAGHPTLAEKIDRLIRSKRIRDRRDYSYKDLATAIRAHGGASISTTYLWELHTGAKDNPQKKTLETLADFFAVPVTYFFDTDEALETYDRLETLPIALDANVRSIALRAAELSPDTLKAISQIIEQARQIEGIHNGRRDVRHGRTDPDGSFREVDEE